MARARALDGLRIAELRERASQAGVSGTVYMHKEELIDALRGGESLSTSGRFRRSTTDVLAALKADHAKLKGLFGEALAKAGGDPAIEPIAQRIVAELARHATVEETLRSAVLPAQAVEWNAVRADGVLDAGTEKSVREQMAQLTTPRPSNAAYRAVMRVMSDRVEQRTEKRDSGISRQARDRFDRAEPQEAGEWRAAVSVPPDTDASATPSG